MTNDVIELLRHHENPRQVLTRGVPRFKPFDLQAALAYASSLYGKDAHFIEPCIYTAFCNAHSSEFVWLLTSVGDSSPYAYAHTGRYWGTPRAAKQHASTRFYQRDVHWWVLVGTDPTSDGLAEVEFVNKNVNYYPYSNISNFENLASLELLLVNTILDEWRKLSTFASLEQTHHNIKVSIPTAQLGDVIARYDELFSNNEMLILGEDRSSCGAGDLLKEQASKQHITNEELERWLGPPPEHETMGYPNNQAEPTFAIPPEQAALPFDLRKSRGDFDNSDIPF